ncbi:sigma-70 family RNA polymerase sigma factor [Flavivirga aquimarina]|uniref:Sigma-70 family RNA polymerase sigma factor n=1 Tax=Flavivirga aquimarina TaxID=2027862 RepID=A0ABT8W8S5_9FLAO|nr:sigma-70 family RNA polymerase sigma factor [Flavivirga aquimarina]MDO5969542.1 sigma-70 family RNA polymerase sigma factor [Flavivirga aquimarina]
MPKDFLDNKFLIESLIKEDEKAYSFLVDTYNKKLSAYALSLTKNHYSSQDIVQVVFLRTWEFRKKLNPSYSIKNFLYKSVYNEFVNRYHKDKSISNLDRIFIENLNNVIDHKNEAILKEKISFVNSEIEKLPPKCKQVFILSKKEGLTNVEIANYLGVTVKSVEKHITKGFSLIRKEAKKKIKFILFQLCRLLKLT